ncbi:MAG: hypothetical protein IJ473_01660 [Alphaproteobacteria bacterium]|nr:hypothetical protein [Alphaproteobacteria bacterium]
MKTVFLSGPMKGVDRKEAQQWRKQASKLLGKQFKTITPYRGREEKETFPDPKGAVVRDKSDILSCDLIIVNDSYSDASMIGTSMEILFGYEHNKPIIVFGQAHPKDYWLNYHASIRVETLKDACEICKKLFHD